MTRILAVDDEPDWLAFAKEDLGKSFEVEVALDLKTTMTMLKQKPYDLIIAGSRCLNVLKVIREKYPQKRVIVATGQPTTREAIDTYRLGALDYFTKDFRPEIISAKINEALQKPHKILA
ncbi:MAG: response regulator [Anaerolineales bacterium]|nr:response regulator [Anaerolineales bacterium]